MSTSSLRKEFPFLAQLPAFLNVTRKLLAEFTHGLCRRSPASLFVCRVLFFVDGDGKLLSV